MADTSRPLGVDSRMMHIQKSVHMSKGTGWGSFANKVDIQKLQSGT